MQRSKPWRNAKSSVEAFSSAALCSFFFTVAKLRSKTISLKINIVLLNCETLSFAFRQPRLTLDLLCSLCGTGSLDIPILATQCLQVPPSLVLWKKFKYHYSNSSNLTQLIFTIKTDCIKPKCKSFKVLVICGFPRVSCSAQFFFCCSFKDSRRIIPWNVYVLLLVCLTWFPVLSQDMWFLSN